MIHGILPVQFTCLTVFFHNLCPSFLWSFCWPGTPTSYSLHFFTQSLFSFRCTCPYIATCFAVAPKLCHLILVSLSNLYLEFATYPSNHSHLCPLKYHIIFLSYRPVLTSMWHTTLHTTAVQSPFTINDISLLVGNGTNCLNLFHPILISVLIVNV